MLMTPVEQIPVRECWRLLAAPNVARVVWSRADGPQLRIFNYLCQDGGLWFKIDPASDLAHEADDLAVVVEVDNIDIVGRSGWSVMLWGHLVVADPGEAPYQLTDLDVWAAGDRSRALRLSPTRITGHRLHAPRSGG